MVDSLLDNEESVRGALLRTGLRELTLSSIERNMLVDLRAFLQHFKRLTTLVSGNLPHLGLISLIRHEIMQICKPCQGDSSLTSGLKCHVLDNLDNRIPESKLSHLAGLLDPAIKDIIQLSQEEKRTMLMSACESLTSRLSSRPRTAATSASESVSDHDASTDAVTGPSGSTDEQPSKSIKRQLVERIRMERGNTVDVGLSEMIDRYLGYSPQPSELDDVLAFWRMHAAEFKELLPVARNVLCVSASSVPVECMFSSTGLILNSKRAMLSPSTLNFTCFIHDNTANG